METLISDIAKLKSMLIILESTQNITGAMYLSIIDALDEAKEALKELQKERKN